MNSHPPRFHPGDRVQYRSDRAKIGEVEGAPTPVQGYLWYRVRLINGSIETVPETDLETFRAAQDPRGLFAEGRFGGPEDFVRKATFHKLSQPLQNTLYSLGAARIEFYPHQYKPLLKFVDSDDQRLLIADEVGLGKTIEAGLILVELRARRQLGQVLIVCPAALVPKWRDEMQTRFDEDFRVLTSQDFRNLISRFQDQHELGDLRAILSLQSLRQRGNRELIEATPLPLDLLIVDEAHHLRNPGTLSHRTVDALAVEASSIAFLTATPIHLGSENLFYLLRILGPGEFNDVRSFDERLQANVPIVECERLARITPLPCDEILHRLEGAGSGPYSAFFTENPFYLRSLRLLTAGSSLERDGQIELEANLKDLNLFSHVITRSRKRDVIENPAVRSPVVVTKRPTHEELAFYRAVTEFVRSIHGQGTGGYFAAITAQRQVASCMQAAKEHFRSRAFEVLEDPELSDVDTDTWNEPLNVPEEPDSLPEQLLLAAERLGDVDTKLAALLEQITELEAEEHGRKILIFSYFKATLRYLERKLGEVGLSCVRIDGDVNSDPNDPEKDDRGRIMEAFRDDPNVQILLSSEVGSEGLDFQFCHILINYDLPWNPMRVEQRIGRLDRLGQDSDRIVIINLSLPGTIEHRILQRLYQRIGIFERSIGDLEAILGEEIEKLTRDLLSRHLTEEEEDRRIEQTARALELRKGQLDRLEQEGDRFIGRDSYFDEQLERARRGGEVLAGRDLLLFLQEFLTHQHPDSTLRHEDGDGVYTLDVDKELEDHLRAMHDPRPIWHRLLHRVVRGRGRIAVTFDSAKAFADPELEFLAPHHPLLLLAVRHYEDHPEELHPTSALAIEEADGIPAGTYVYLLYEVEIRAGRKRHRLEPFLVSVETGEPVDRHLASLAYGRMLRHGSPAEVDHWDSDDARALLKKLEDRFLLQMATDQTSLRERQDARVKTRLLTLKSSFERKISRKRELLSEARSEGKPVHYLRLLEGTIRNLEAGFSQRRAEIEAERDVHMSHALVATGLLQVGG